MNRKGFARRAAPGGLAVVLFRVAFGILAAATIGVLIAQVLVSQRTAEAHHRMAAIRREMGELRVERETVETQQAALLTREALKQRLENAGLGLDEIPPGSVVIIEEPESRERGMAMGGALPSAR